MPVSTVIKNLTDGTIVISDATGSPITTTPQLDVGDFSFSLPNETSDYETRGTFRGSRRAAFQLVTGSFSCQVAAFTAATGDSPAIDLVKKAGKFAAGVSTYGANYPVMAYTMAFTVEGTNFGDSADHVATFTGVQFTSVEFAEGDPNTYNVAFKATGGVAVT